MKDRTQLLAQAQKPNEERSPPQGMPPGFPFPR
jgi:hypothetical protein